MKEFLGLIIGCFMIFALSGIAGALTIEGGSIEVGSLDQFIKKANLGNSGESTELDWANLFLNPDTSFSYKIEQGFDWTETDTTGIWANSLADSPDYFLIKTGGNNNTHYLFENSDFMSYAVIDLSVFDAPGNSGGLTISGISHITAFGSSPIDGNQVPEPATMLLFGVGLLGLAGVSRRKK
jgi:PEP-CTERM motif